MKKGITLIAFLILIIYPSVALADGNFQGSTFAISGSNLRHTYIYNGAEKTSSYSLLKEGDKAIFNLNDIACPGYKNSASVSIYEYQGMEKHTQTFGGRSTQSSYYLFVSGGKTSKLYYKTHLLSGSGTCFALAGQKEESKEYHDSQEYEENSFIYQYIRQVNSSQASINGVGTRSTDHPFSISGTIKINYDGAKLPDQKSGNGDYPNPDSSHVYEVRLWHKNDGESSYTSLDEKATINSEGHFNFPNIIRPSGQYIVANLIYSDGKDFTNSPIHSLGEGENNPTIPATNSTNSTTSNECFYAKSQVLNIAPDAPSKDYSVELTAKTVGKCEIGTDSVPLNTYDSPTCAIFKNSGGVTGWVYTKIIAKPVCLFAQLMLTTTQFIGQKVGELLNSEIY